jgi:hypothetical protein
VTHRSIASKSSVALQVRSGEANARGGLRPRLRRQIHARPVRTSPRLVFAVVLAVVLSSGTLLSTSITATQAKIKTDWATFFAGTTPAKHKVALLQNGQSFAAVINAQASNPMSKSSAAKVLSVTVTSKTQAKVRYTITLGGQAALSNQTGVAVLQDGTWKVGDQSFCALLALEQTKTPACPTK